VTLEEATSHAVSAAKAGDLDALEFALTARAQAIAAGGLPTREILEAGNHTLQILKGLIARLTHLREAVGREDTSPGIDCRF
jgi:hypothetical protein